MFDFTIPVQDLTAYMKKGVDYVTAGQKTGTALGSSATAEGVSNTASGTQSHCEGQGNISSAAQSHAEGIGNTSSSTASHAEGGQNTASNQYAHAEGYQCTASALTAHAEGRTAVASGAASHAQNKFTIAAGDSQTVIGKYNVSNTTSALIVGNGSSDTARSNAATMDFAGNMTISGILTQGNGETVTDTGAVTKALTANKFCNFTGAVTTLTIALPATYNPWDEFNFCFTTDSTGGNLALPSTVTWLSGSAPSLAASTYYEVSICNNKVVIAP